MRFGRVLGIGTRLAAKTLVSAMDAATTANPAGTGGGAQPAASQSAEVGRGLGQKTVQKATQARVTASGLKRGGRRFGEAVWGPFVKLSGVLWLEVTGVFFGVFALLAGSGAWKQRAAIHGSAANPQAQGHVLLLAGVAVLFAYFCVSSFVKANRRGRRK